MAAVARLSDQNDAEMVTSALYFQNYIILIQSKADCCAHADAIKNTLKKLQAIPSLLALLYK